MAKVRRSGPGIESLSKSLEDVERRRAEVGFFDTSYYPDGTPAALVAVVQEFGSGAIPPRPFMRSTATDRREAWKKLLAAGSRRVLSGEMTMAQMLESFGMRAAGQVKEKIASIDTPALAQSTLYARQHRTKKPRNTSEKPLVDEGILISSVDSKVVDR